MSQPPDYVGTGAAVAGHKSHAPLVRILLVVLAVLLVAWLTYSVSKAAFTGSTAATGNATTGTVVLTSDSSGSTLFDVVGLNGGDAFSSCVAVRYDGSIVPAPVVLHGATTGNLPPYLNMTIDVGTGKTFTPGDTGCTTFTSTGRIFTGTLAAFTTAHTGLSNALNTTWTAGVQGDVKSFRFILTVQNDNAAQGKSASPTFTWESAP